MNTPSETSRLRFDGECTVRTASDAKHRLLDFINNNSDIAIECHDITDVDLGFIQLLIAARASAARLDRAFRLAKPASGCLLDALRRGGFVPARSPADHAFWLQPHG